MKLNLFTLALSLVSVASAADLPYWASYPSVFYNDADQLIQPSDKTQTLTFGAPDQPDYAKISVGPHVFYGGVVRKKDLPRGGYARTSSYVNYTTTETIPDNVIDDVAKMMSHAVKGCNLMKKDQENTPKAEDLPKTDESNTTAKESKNNEQLPAKTTSKLEENKDKK